MEKSSGQGHFHGNLPCAPPKHMEAYPADENIAFDGEDTFVKDTWTAYVSDGNAILAEPEDYMTLR